jgi:hypothetical protein
MESELPRKKLLASQVPTLTEDPMEEQAGKSKGKYQIRKISGVRSSATRRDHGELDSNSFGSPSPPTLRVVVGIEGEEGGGEEESRGEERRRAGYNKKRERGGKGKSTRNGSHKSGVFLRSAKEIRYMLWLVIGFWWSGKSYRGFSTFPGLEFSTAI